MVNGIAAAILLKCVIKKLRNLLFLYKYQTSEENNLYFCYSLNKSIIKIREKYIYYNN